MPMLCLKEFKKTFSLARKSTEYNCTSPLVIQLALLTSESWELLKLVKDPPATKGREIAFHRLMSVTKDLNQSKASEEVIYKALVNSWRFSRHLGTFASVIKDPCLQKLWNWGGDNLVQRCRFYFLKFLLEIELNDSFFLLKTWLK